MAEVKSAHGGRRLNSGRKRSLSFWERMEIGGLCEAKWSALSKTAAMSAFESQPHNIDVHEEQRRTKAIPVKLRSSQEPWPAGTRPTEPLTPKEIIDEVSQEIDSILSSAGVSRLVSIPIRRPQRAKESVLEEVLLSIGGIPGRKITKRMVKRCWDEYRSLEAEIRSEQS